MNKRLHAIHEHNSSVSLTNKVIKMLRYCNDNNLEIPNIETLISTLECANTKNKFAFDELYKIKTTDEKI